MPRRLKYGGARYGQAFPRSAAFSENNVSLADITDLSHILFSDINGFPFVLSVNLIKFYETDYNLI